MLLTLIVVWSIAVAYIDGGNNAYYVSGLSKRSCLNECYKHVGVYYIKFINSTTYEIVTFHPDGTFSGVTSDKIGISQYSTNPDDTPYSNEYGTWKCNGENGIEATSFDFSFPTLAQPCFRAVDENPYSFTFDHDQVEGKSTYTSYKLESLRQNQSPVEIIMIEGSFQGYKVFDLC
ncbi:unnamed protein product [Didymodactylos carnosus]|uniref:Uncharacterized protein n=1 Tax=Didymodactylos carnosus TaxID=1234261 RepID=A0A814U361_9BILA|nr:unnamed protein product [Didymodactylos carnosus]CAF3932996.1 unnamed protein product [Didymodactylos carnosus]CAF4456437.1 unnamed protein product [Didymodactylos carnosus]